MNNNIIIYNIKNEIFVLISVYFLCRRGNDSQRTISYLKDKLKPSCKLVNITGGLHLYAKQVDENFPVY